MTSYVASHPARCTCGHGTEPCQYPHPVPAVLDCPRCGDTYPARVTCGLCQGRGAVGNAARLTG